MTVVPTSSPLVLQDVRLPGQDQLRQLAIRDGRVVALRPSVEVDGAEVVRLEGRTVLPGLWDAHVHATQWALSRHRLDLRDAASAAEAAAMVGAAADDMSDRSAPLVGAGMRHLEWADDPHREMLDAAAPGVAVVLQGVDLHTAWLSTAALARTGAADHPTGLLHEAECFRAVAALPEASPARRDEMVAEAMAAAARLGVTGIRDFEMGDSVVDWQRRVATHDIAVRVATTVYPDHLDAAIARGWPTGQPAPGTDGQVTAGHLKVFVDGSLNSCTALCEAPYPGPPPVTHGRLETPPDELAALMARAWRHGIESAVHAIGDRAVRLALDAFERVGCPGRIEHAQLVAADDVPRFAPPGPVASVQPAHAPDDRDVAERLWAGRTSRAYPFADLVAAGARLEIGSDAPVSGLDPWAGIAAAVLRTADDRPPWHPEQSVDVATALAASTGGRDRVRVGDDADLVVLDDDPLRCSPQVLRAPSVWGTMLAGRWTHRQ